MTREEVPLTRMLLYMLPLFWPLRSTLTLMMQESDACWLYMGSEVMDTERLWRWEVRGGFGPALPVVTETAELICDWEPQEELDFEGVSGEEPVMVEHVDDEVGEVVVEDREEAEVEQEEEQERVSIMLHEL